MGAGATDMTDNTQPEALDLANWLDAVGNGGISSTAAAAELRRLHAENEALQQGYAAARLEIESLRARSVVPAVREAVAKAIYDQWVYKDGWVAWVNGGNSLRQDDARRLADLAFAMAQAAPAAVAGPSEAVKFTDQSTADPVEKARRYLTAMGSNHLHSSYFFDDGYPKQESAADALATLAVLEQLAAAPTTQPAPKQEAQEPVAWYVTGCGRLLDEYEAEAEARRIGGTAKAMPLYTVPQPSPASQGDALDAARWRWLSEHIQVAWNEGKFTSLVRIVSEQHRQSLNASVDRMMAGDWSDADAARAHIKKENDDG